MSASKQKRTAPLVKAHGLTKSLAANAERAHAQKLERLRVEAHDDLTLIKLKQAEIVEQFYEIGEALTRLKREGVAKAMGRKTFAELVVTDLSMSITSAERLIAVVRYLRREDALRFGQDKSYALVRLASATADPSDTPAMLIKTKMKLASGRILDIEHAKPSEILLAAKEVRQARQKGAHRGKGRTTTPDERAVASRIASLLHHAGVRAAKVVAVATKPGGTANLRIEGVPMNRIAALHSALGKVL